MVLLVPVTFPPCAQAAHTSGTDKSTHTDMERVEKQGSNVAKSGLFPPLYHSLICSHAINMLFFSCFFFFFFFFKAEYVTDSGLFGVQHRGRGRLQASKLRFNKRK